MSNPILNITTTHHCHIEYFANDEEEVNTVLRIEMRIDKLKKPDGLEWMSSSGGPAHNPYITIECNSKKSVIDFASKVIRLISQYKNTQIVSA